MISARILYAYEGSFSATLPPFLIATAVRRKVLYIAPVSLVVAGDHGQIAVDRQNQESLHERLLVRWIYLPLGYAHRTL